MTDNSMHNPSLEFALKAIQDEARKPLQQQINQLREALKLLVAQHDRPHGFDDAHWYHNSLIVARLALNATEENE